MKYDEKLHVGESDEENESIINETNWLKTNCTNSTTELTRSMPLQKQILHKMFVHHIC